MLGGKPGATHDYLLRPAEGGPDRVVGTKEVGIVIGAPFASGLLARGVEATVQCSSRLADWLAVPTIARGEVLQDFHASCLPAVQ